MMSLLSLETLENHINELQRIYPLIWHLVGARCARQAAGAFVRKSLSIKDFPTFLENFSPLKAFPYLPDVARLEWLQHQALEKPHRLSLTSHQLRFTSEEISPLRFIAHPSLSLFASPYPLEKIWNLGEPSGKILLSAESSWALVIRPECTLEMYWLTCESYTFFESLVEGYTLAQSAEKALLLCPTFNFQEALQFAFSKNLFVATYLSFPRDC